MKKWTHSLSVIGLSLALNACGGSQDGQTGLSPADDVQTNFQGYYSAYTVSCANIPMAAFHTIQDGAEIAMPKTEFFAVVEETDDGKEYLHFSNDCVGVFVETDKERDTANASITGPEAEVDDFVITCDDGGECSQAYAFTLE